MWKVKSIPRFICVNVCMYIYLFMSALVHSFRNIYLENLSLTGCLIQHPDKTAKDRILKFWVRVNHSWQHMDYLVLLTPFSMSSTHSYHYEIQITNFKLFRWKVKKWKQQWGGTIIWGLYGDGDQYRSSLNLTCLQTKDNPMQNISFPSLSVRTLACLDQTEI